MVLVGVVGRRGGGDLTFVVVGRGGGGVRVVLLGREHHQQDVGIASFVVVQVQAAEIVLR